MTISTEVRKAGPFIGNDSASVFPFAFKVFKAADLIVVRRQDNIGEETTLVLDSDYHVTLNSNQDTTPGGVVTLVAGALASGFTLVVSSELPYLQPTDLTNQGGFYPKVITNALDRLTIFCQQLAEITGRTLKLPITAPTDISAEIPLPNPSELIAWDETGTRLTTISPQSLVTSIAYGSATADLFAGDGVTTTFPLSTNPASVNNLDVSIGGYSQRPVQDGVGDYSWNGGTSITFVTPPPVPSIPGDKNVLVRYMQAIPVSDSEALHAQTREALRRSYADAGLNLVEGSFEEGGELFVASDVMITASGDGYSWGGPEFPHNVAPGTDPTAVAGYVPRTDVVLRSRLAADDGASMSLSMLATTYGVSYASGSIWTPGSTMNVGQWAYYGNKLWAPNADATVCGAVPDYTNFHTLNVNKILRPENFGAVKGVDATAAINRLVVYQTTYGMGLVQLLDEFEYLVSPATHAGLPGTFGGNSVCINLVSNLNIQGGNLKLRDGTGGASGAILANMDGVAINNVVVSVSIDGNKANTTGTMSGVVIVKGDNCHWDGEGRTVKNLSFNGVQFALSNLGCSAKGGTYKNITYIGLQAQRADGFQALHGHFYSIGDNAIDLEANNGNMDQNIIGYNVVNGCNCGVFLESGGNSIVIGNSIEVFKDVGVICNQINTPSTRNLITANKIKRGAGVGTIGIRFVNNSGYSSVYGNYFEGLDYSIRATMATSLHVGVNTHMDIKKQLVYIDATTNSLTYSLVERQVLMSERNSSTGYPFSTAPLNNSNNHSDRSYKVTVEPMFRAMANSVASSSDAEYIKSTYNTVHNASWAAYAVYTGGHTLVNMPGVATGNYVLINGTLYLLYDFVGGGWQIRDLAGLDGNFTATVNGNYPVTEYYTAWQTN